MFERSSSTNFNSAWICPRNILRRTVFVLTPRSSAASRIVYSILVLDFLVGFFITMACLVGLTWFKSNMGLPPRQGV